MIDKDILIKELGLKKAELHGMELKACCPNPNHPDKNPSWSFNLDSQFYNCWSCNFSGKGVAGLYLKLGKEIPAWALSDNLTVTKKPVHTAKQRVKKVDQVVEVRQTWMSWLSANPGLAFEKLKVRDILESSIKKFEIGYNARYDILYFPVKNTEGKLLGWAERSDNWDFKYKIMPLNVNREGLLFGENHIIEGKPNEVFLVEGPIDAIKLWQWGFMAVATLFANLMEKQAEKIIDLASTVIYVPDNDKAGMKMTHQVLDKLKNKVILYGVNLPEGIKDVGENECTLKVFQEVLKNKVKI